MGHLTCEICGKVGETYGVEFTNWDGTQEVLSICERCVNVLMPDQLEILQEIARQQEVDAAQDSADAAHYPFAF